MNVVWILKLITGKYKKFTFQVILIKYSGTLLEENYLIKYSKVTTGRELHNSLPIVTLEYLIR